MSTTYSNILVHGKSGTTYSRVPVLSMNITIGSVTRSGSTLSLNIESANLNGTNSTTYFGYDLNVYAKLGDGNLVQLFAKPASDSQWDSTSYVVSNISISESNNTTTNTTLKILVNASCDCSSIHPTVTMWSTTLTAPIYDQSSPPSGISAGVVYDTSPVTVEYTIKLTSFGTTSGGSAATISYGNNTYIRLLHGSQVVETKTYSSGDFVLNANTTKLFQSLAPSTTYTVEFKITNSAGKSFTGGGSFTTKSIAAPTIPTFVNATCNTPEPESGSTYILYWSNPSNTGYSGGTEVSGTSNVMRFVIQNIYCNDVGLLSSNNQSTYNHTSNTNYMSLRFLQDGSDLKFYWENETTPFYTKSNYSLPEGGMLKFKIAAQRVYIDRSGGDNRSPTDANLDFVTSNIVGPIQDQASIYVLVNNVWKRGKVFVKVDNDWKKAKKVFSKVNDQWIGQSNS